MSNFDQLTEQPSPEPDPAGTPPPKAQKRSIVIVGASVLVVLLLLVGFSQGWFGGDSDTSGPSPEADAKVTQAVSLIESSDFAGAQAILQEVIASDPSNVLANYNLGVIAQFSNLNDEAIRYYSVALEGNPLFPSALYNIGLAYRDTGNVAQALSNWKTLVANFPDHVPGLYNLGNLLVEQGDAETGNAFLARAQKLDPSIGS